MFEENRLSIIEKLLISAGWEKVKFENIWSYHTPESWKEHLHNFQVGHYRIYDAIKIQTYIDSFIIDKLEHNKFET